MSPPSLSKNKSRSANFERTRITRACDHCKQRRTKCDSAKPQCSQCAKFNDCFCTFTTRVNKRGPKPKQCIKYCSTFNNEKQHQNSTSTIPHTTCFSLSTQPIDLKDNTNSKTKHHRFICYQQSSSPNNSDSTLNGSKLPTSTTDFNNCRKLPIFNQNSNSSPSLPSFQTFCTNLSTPSLSNNRKLRFKSLDNKLNLPPINILLSVNDKFQQSRGLRKLSISSPRYYKLKPLS